MATQILPEQVFPVSAEQLAALADSNSRFYLSATGLVIRLFVGTGKYVCADSYSPASNTTDSDIITIISASQTGNARRVCEELKRVSSVRNSWLIW